MHMGTSFRPSTFLHSFLALNLCAAVSKSLLLSYSYHGTTATAQLSSNLQDDESGAWTDISAVIIVTGKRDPSVLQYLKSVAFHQWLFGIEVAGVSHALNGHLIALNSLCTWLRVYCQQM